jgi:uroporphyrinogen-III decarboxylase
MIGKVFPGDAMTSRERLLAAYRGQPTDRLPWWAKVCNDTWRTSQPEKVRSWSDLELLDYIHADGLFTRVPGPVRVERPHVKVERVQTGSERRVRTATPDGAMTEAWRLDPSTQSWHPTEFPVKAREDLGRRRWLYRDVRLTVDGQALARARELCAAVGERGLTVAGWGTSPLMDLVEHVIGPVQTAYLLADYPEETGELIGLMHQASLAYVRFFAEHTPADVVVSVENTSTTLISPGQFEEHCFGPLGDYGRAIEGAGKIHELHMCGHTLALLERINQIPASSIEAFTSPTLGNTRLADGRARAPSKTLIGGTNVNTWLLPAEKIQEYVLAELAACPDRRRIILTTAGVAPPGCPAEKFRAIGEWLPSLPALLRPA